MDKQKMTEKQIAKMYTQVMKDDTYWDDMTAAELEKRLDDFNAHKKSQDKLVALISCLRLAPCVYLRERTEDTWSIPCHSHTGQSRVYGFYLGRANKERKPQSL